MTLAEIIMSKVRSMAGNGLVNVAQQCGCGDHDGWYQCDCPDMDGCCPARWCFCKECKQNGKCVLQSDFDFLGQPDDGCYKKLAAQEEK